MNGEYTYNQKRYGDSMIVIASTVAQESAKQAVQRQRDVALAPEPNGLDADPLTAKTVKDVRAFLDVTADEFAVLLGVTTRTVRAWEHNRTSNSRNCTGPARLLIRRLVEDAKASL